VRDFTALRRALPSVGDALLVLRPARNAAPHVLWCQRDTAGRALDLLTAPALSTGVVAWTQAHPITDSAHHDALARLSVSLSDGAEASAAGTGYTSPGLLPVPGLPLVIGPQLQVCYWLLRGHLLQALIADDGLVRFDTTDFVVVDAPGCDARTMQRAHRTLLALAPDDAPHATLAMPGHRRVPRRIILADLSVVPVRATTAEDTTTEAAAAAPSGPADALTHHEYDRLAASLWLVRRPPDTGHGEPLATGPDPRWVRLDRIAALALAAEVYAHPGRPPSHLAAPGVETIRHARPDSHTPTSAHWTITDELMLSYDAARDPLTVRLRMPDSVVVTPTVGAHLAAALTAAADRLADARRLLMGAHQRRAALVTAMQQEADLAAELMPS
jgi:hypothetical protein